MRWPDRSNEWRRRFAILPAKIGDEWVWLEWIECRPCGYYTEVRHAENS